MTRSVEGWYADEELALLAATAKARAKSEAAFVEVGVFRGRSAAVLAPHTTHLVLVDNFSMGDFSGEWPPHELAFTSALDASREVEDVILFHQDASHGLIVVLEHLRLFLPKVIKGGAVCLHDFQSMTYPGVRAAWVAATRGQKEAWGRIGLAGSLVVFERIR
jgi:hypothetical protein